MTNELEKQFFQCFGIEPREFKSCDVGTFCPYPEKECGTDTCPYYKTYKFDYPAISDRILLELICIAHTSPVITFCSRNVVNLKNEVLNVLCNYIDSRDIKHQVRTLFEEG